MPGTEVSAMYIARRIKFVFVNNEQILINVFGSNFWKIDLIWKRSTKYCCLSKIFWNKMKNQILIWFCNRLCQATLLNSLFWRSKQIHRKLNKQTQLEFDHLLSLGIGFQNRRELLKSVVENFFSPFFCTFNHFPNYGSFS